MTYTGPSWVELQPGQHVSIHRYFGQPQGKTRSRHLECNGTLLNVAPDGFILFRDGGQLTFHSWDPGPQCHQTIAPDGDGLDRWRHEVSPVEGLLADVLRVKKPRSLCGALLPPNPLRCYGNSQVELPLCPRCASVGRRSAMSLLSIRRGRRAAAAPTTTAELLAWAQAAAAAPARLNHPGAEAVRLILAEGNSSEAHQ